MSPSSKSSKDTTTDTPPDTKTESAQGDATAPDQPTVVPSKNLETIDGLLISPDNPTPAPEPGAAPSPALGSGEAVTRHTVLSLEGRRCIALKPANKDGTYPYLDVEYFGDPDDYSSYQVAPVDGNDAVMDVGYGTEPLSWARVSIDTGPLHVTDYVD